MKNTTSTHSNITDIINNEINLKRQLVEATDAVRKKFNSIKNRQMESQVALEKFYEPITKPLRVMSTAVEVKPIKKPTGSRSPQLQLETPFRRTQVTEKDEDRTFAASLQRRKGGDDDDDEAERGITQTSFMDTPSSSSMSLMATSSPESSAVASAGEIQDIVKKHIEKIMSGDPAYDGIYGVRIDPNSGKLQMGNVEVRFSNGNITLWQNEKRLKVYPGNPELYDIMFLKYPPILKGENRNIDESNLKIYKEILQKTKAPYVNYDIRQGVNTTNGKKYREIIKPLISYKIKTRSKSGTGLLKLPNMKHYNRQTKVEYVYWNKVRELVARLRLLWGSKMAGNTSHDNEIINIIEELREEGIVY